MQEMTLDIYGITINMKTIIYMEVLPKSVQCYLVTGEVVSYSRRVRTHMLEKLLKKYQFIRIDETYLINERFIQTILLLYY